MVILAPFVLQRVFGDMKNGKALKSSIALRHSRSAGFVCKQLLALWISVARVNYLLFQDFIKIPEDLYALSYYIKEERDLFLELGALVAGFEKATPNFHAGLHLPEQIWQCTYFHSVIC